jgi:hypothetical protein
MTKERQLDDELGHRVRNKGPNYIPPDLKKIILDYRKYHQDGADYASMPIAVKLIANAEAALTWSADTEIYAREKLQEIVDFYKIHGPDAED